MPKKQVTQEQINEIMKKSKKNFKYSFFDFGNVSDRLKKAAKKWQGLNKAREDNSQLTKNSQGDLVISNNKLIKTEVALNTNREYYEENSFTTTFDTEVTQLVTKAPPTPPPPKEEIPPPPSPTNLQINCTNYHWSMDGLKGRTEKDKASWHHNYHPMSNNPKGGYLIIPNDHPLFYIRTLEPKHERHSFNYEWSVDGEVVSDQPGFNLYNCSDQGVGASDWDKDNDRKWHSHWRECPDVIVECRVWNESGEVKAKVPYRCAYNIGSNSHKDDDGKPIPRWKWDGYREFDSEKFYDGSTWSFTKKIWDAEKGVRTFRVKNVIFDSFNSSVYTRPQRYKALLNKQIPYKEIPWLSNHWHIGNLGHNIDMASKLTSNIKGKAKAFVDTVPGIISDHTCPFGFHKSINKYNNHMNEAYIGEVCFRHKWVSFKDFWSGYEADVDWWDAKNFMKLNKAKTKRDDDGTSGMDSAGKWGKYPTQNGAPGDWVQFAFKFGYAAIDNKKKKIFYLYYADWGRTVTVDDERDIDVTLNLSRYDCIYYEPTDINTIIRGADKMWSVSRGI